MKYYEGEPVIREIQRVSKPGVAFILGQNHAGCAQWFGHFHHLNAERCDVG